MFENFLVIYFKYENLPKGVEPCSHTHPNTQTQTHTWQKADTHTDTHTHTSLLPAHFMRKKKRTVKHVKS